MFMTRDEAIELVNEWTQKPALRTHMLAVEAAMCRLARHFGQDEERWGITGLLHDFDYERHETLPKHPVQGVAVLEQKGVEPDIRQAILGHANLPEYPRETLMDKALFAADELTGLVMAATYVRPSKSVLDLEVKSVKKRMKEKAFAAGVNRDDILQGTEELGIELDQLIELVIEGLREHAQELGLAGPN
jgi:putative nucleotidyltransferase with HDIG domain